MNKSDNKEECNYGDLHLIVQAFLRNPENFLKYEEVKDAEEEGEYVEFESLDRLPSKASDYVIRVYDIWLAEDHDIDAPILIPESSSNCENCSLFGDEICLGCGHSCSHKHISQLCIGRCHAGFNDCSNETVNCPSISHVCVDCLSIKCDDCGEPKYNQSGGYMDSCPKCREPSTDSECD